ncbi:MAG: hypothetical protein PVI88_02005 [Nitrosopumilaceae archaeon]|jgi:hypothetical protein
MRNLIDSHGDYLKTENNIKDYLASMNDKELKKLYDTIELTPFPILLVHEYRKRFKEKQNLRN